MEIFNDLFGRRSGERMERPVQHPRFIVNKDLDADIKILSLRLPDGSYAYAVHPDVLRGDPEVWDSARDAVMRDHCEVQTAA